MTPIYPLDANSTLREQDILTPEQERAFKAACGNLASTAERFAVMREFVKRYEAAKPEASRTIRDDVLSKIRHTLDDPTYIDPAINCRNLTKTLQEVERLLQ